LSKRRHNGDNKAEDKGRQAISDTPSFLEGEISACNVSGCLGAMHACSATCSTSATPSTLVEEVFVCTVSVCLGVMLVSSATRSTSAISSSLAEGVFACMASV
jgi:hypothetical protein